MQSRRDGAAANRFFKRLRKGLQYTPRVLVKDKLKSYAVAKREVLPDLEHRESRYLKQPSGKLAPADPAARAANAAVQVDAPGTALPIRSRFHLCTIPPAAPSYDSQPASCRACKSPQELDTGDVRPKWRMTAPVLPRSAVAEVQLINVTILDDK